ncbi:MAG: hypothetical protein RLZZ540_276 [Bacteroidota bacterium]|jgi:hypothetical protein
MRININVAQKWNDLTEFQVNAIGKFMFNARNEQVETKFFKRVILSVLLVPKFTFRNIIKSVIVLSNVPFSELEQYTAFVFDEKELLTRFPAKIKIGRWPFRKVVYGPAMRMANCTIEELSYADTFYYKWTIEKNTDDLHRLTAILYRPKGEKSKKEDLREPFSNLLLESNSHITDKISFPVKFMIAHAYSGCRQNFINRNPNVFPQKKKVEGEEDKTPAKPKPYYPFSKIIDAFAMDEVQIFGNHQQVEKVLASKFLSIYDESIVRQREKERKNK